VKIANQVSVCCLSSLVKYGEVVFHRVVHVMQNETEVGGVEEETIAGERAAMRAAMAIGIEEVLPTPAVGSTQRQAQQQAGTRLNPHPHTLALALQTLPWP